MWDVGTPIVGESVIAPPAAIVRVELTSIPDYLSKTSDNPPRYRWLGTIGWTIEGARTRGETLIYADQLIDRPVEQADGIYVILALNVAGTLYRGVDLGG